MIEYITNCITSVSYTHLDVYKRQESRGLVIVVFQDFAEIPWNQKCTFDFLSNQMPSGQGENGAPANYSYQITFKASIAGEPQMGILQ